MAMAATKWKFPVDRAASIPTTHRTTGQLEHPISVPNCKWICGKFDTTGARRISWEALVAKAKAKDKTMTLATKIIGFLQGPGMASDHC